jgi:hypothetical protein
MTYDEVLHIVQQWPPQDKARLLAAISSGLEHDLARLPSVAQSFTTAQPKPNLLGLWQGVNIADATISEARREMWRDLTSDDI